MTGIAGYRAFKVTHAGVLESVVHAHNWERGVNAARPCGIPLPPSFRDDAPNDEALHPSIHCHCGIHAFYDDHDNELNLYDEPDGCDCVDESCPSPYAFGSSCIAAIVATGRVVMHASGWRASKAEVVGILSTRSKATDEAIRLRYDVPVVFYRDELRALATKFGALIEDPSGQFQTQRWAEVEVYEKPPSPEFKDEGRYQLTGWHGGWNPLPAFPTVAPVNAQMPSFVGIMPPPPAPGKFTNLCDRPLWIPRLDGSIDIVPPFSTIVITPGNSRV